MGTGAHCRDPEENTQYSPFALSHIFSALVNEANTNSMLLPEQTR